MRDLSADEARRLHLAAQGFGGARTGGSPAKLAKLAQRLNAFQIDSVNVLVRAHYMPAFSRLGPYPMASLDSLAYEKRQLFEFWGHAMCYLPMSLFPAFRWRMDDAKDARWWKQMSPKSKKFVEAVYEEVAERGPIGAGALSIGGKGSGSWWGWSDGKQAVEILLRMGRLAVSGRKNFARLYDLTERVVPKDVHKTPAPNRDDGRKLLLEVAAKAHGVGTTADIAGYYHIENWYDRGAGEKRQKSELPRLFDELVEEGRLQPVSVEGWKEKAYTVPRAKVPATMHTRALVSPFDPLMWERKPTQRLFGFEYKIEIYVPAPKRIYGYYCLPFLLGDRFVARVDLKADRKNKTLLVPGAFAEPKTDKKLVAAELADELRLMAGWLQLETVSVGERGDLAKPLARALR